MRLHNNNPLNQRINLRNIVLLFSLGIGLEASFIWLPIDITITIVLLLGIWGLDAYLKKLLGLGVESALADLSFASLVFVGSRALGLITANSFYETNQLYLLNGVMIAFFLGLFWLANLSLSSIIEYPARTRKDQFALALSFAISLISITTVILAQSNNLI